MIKALAVRSWTRSPSHPPVHASLGLSLLNPFLSSRWPNERSKRNDRSKRQELADRPTVERCHQQTKPCAGNCREQRPAHLFHLLRSWPPTETARQARCFQSEPRRHGTRKLFAQRLNTRRADRQIAGPGHGKRHLGSPVAKLRGQ